MTKNVALYTNTFYYYAEKYRQAVTAEEDIEKINMTSIFRAEIEQIIIKGELINININAQVRKGKSTLAMALGDWIYDLLIKYKHRPKGTTFGIKNIARDQQEKSKKMRDPNTSHTVIVTDESNELEKGGENSSANEALERVFSDVQAARYVHGIACSPKETIDSNADILLSVISRDNKLMITRCKMYYRYYEGGNEYIQLLGYVDFSVKKIIENWEKNVKHIFNKKKHTAEEKAFIAEQMKKDFYVEYVVKKHEKMELITQEGIFRPRILDTAAVIIAVVDQLFPLAALDNVINANIARNYVKIHMRKEKIPTSIVGEELATREVLGILDMYKAQNKAQKEFKRIEKLHNDGKLMGVQYETLSKIATQMYADISKAIKTQIAELERYREINDKYNTVVSEED